MKWTTDNKQQAKRAIVEGLKDDPAIRRIVIFGSFIKSDNPNDLDIAVFQSSDEKYLPLALKYRKKLDNLACRIALDVIPVKSDAEGSFVQEIKRGEVIYER
jgi:uncharacterized protein